MTPRVDGEGGSQNDAAVTAVDSAAQPGGLPQGRFSFVREDNRYVARANAIGKYESVKLSIALPREWLGDTKAGEAHDVEPRAVLRSLARVETFAWVLFALSLAVYAFTRLYKLEDFPISFLGDEAVVGTLARSLMANGFHDPQRGWFPVYFDFFFVINPLISVY